MPGRVVVQVTTDVLVDVVPGRVLVNVHVVGRYTVLTDPGTVEI